MSRELVRVTFMGVKSITLLGLPSSPARPSATSSTKVYEEEEEEEEGGGGE